MRPASVPLLFLALACNSAASGERSGSVPPATPSECVAAAADAGGSLVDRGSFAARCVAVQFGGGGADRAVAVAIFPRGEVRVAGSFGPPEGTYRTFDPFVATFAPDGAEVALSSPPTLANENANEAVFDSSGDAFILYQASASWVGVGIEKVAADGDVLWNVAMPSPNGLRARGFSIALDGAGGIVVAGAFPKRPDAVPNDAVIARIGPDGNLEWMTAVARDDYDSAEALVVDSAGGVYAFGHFVGDGGLDLAKIDARGAVQWIREISDTRVDARDATQGADGSLYVAGGIYGPFVGKFDREGREIWRVSPPDMTGAAAISWGEGDRLWVAGSNVVTELDAASGAVRGTTRLGAIEDVDVRDLAAADDGTVHVVGSTRAAFLGGVNAGDTDAFLVTLTGH